MYSPEVCEISNTNLILTTHGVGQMPPKSCSCCPPRANVQPPRNPGPGPRADGGTRLPRVRPMSVSGLPRPSTPSVLLASLALSTSLRSSSPRSGPRCCHASRRTATGRSSGSVQTCGSTWTRTWRSTARGMWIPRLCTTMPVNWYTRPPVRTFRDSTAKQALNFLYRSSEDWQKYLRTSSMCST